MHVYIKLFHIKPDIWENQALDCGAWLSSVNIGAKIHEEKCICLAKQKAKSKERET
jgi:hypothetical protein